MKVDSRSQGGALCYTSPDGEHRDENEINKLQSVQNAAARVIACLSKFDHISDTLKELHWVPVEQRIIFKINLICLKILNNLAPDYLVDLIHVYEPARYLCSASDKWRLVIKP